MPKLIYSRVAPASDADLVKICENFSQILNEVFHISFDCKDKSAYRTKHIVFESTKTSKVIVFIINQKSGVAFIEISMNEYINVKKRFVMNSQNLFMAEKVLWQVIAAWRELAR